MTEYESKAEIRVERDAAGVPVRATINGDAVDLDDPRVRQAMAAIDAAQAEGVQFAVHTDRVVSVSSSNGTHVTATHDGQPVDPNDPSVQAMITRMQALAQENAQTKKKRRFSFKFGS
jgi:hypothetical protein